ncbi:molybdate ABC transporter substrate-binding protein [Inhella sp.]|uniref:molybdate ABC transporter substrate-binding protein n=1 Tax=Inhella sp. TaxID=1921806 RepID=UPI0035B2138B
MRRRLALSTLLLPAAAQQVLAGPAPLVAAASDLKFALEEIAADFERATGQRVRLVFGSSGQFFAQIRQGAPFELFLSADEHFVFQLAEAGLATDRGRLYARGRIGLFVAHGSPLRADASLGDLALALKDGRLRKLAIAHPDHAPYGMRAREALQHAGLWQAVQPHLVRGENVSQATQFAASGQAEAGIVAASLGQAPAIAAKGRFVLLPETWHQALNQRMALLKSASPSARAFYTHLQSEPARAALQRHGFEVPAP